MKIDLRKIVLQVSSFTMVLYMVAAFLFGAFVVVSPSVARANVVVAQSANNTANSGRQDTSAASVKNNGLVTCGQGGDPNNPNPNACTVDDFFILIARVTNFLIVAAGAYAVLMIVVSAFRLVTARGDQSAITKGKNGLTYAIIGFVLVMIAFAAVNTFVYKIFDVQGASLFGNPFDVTGGK